MIRRSIKNLLSWAVVIGALLVLFVLFPPGPARPGPTTQISWFQLGLTYAAMFFSAVPLVRLAKSPNTGTTQLDRGSQWRAGAWLYFTASASTMVRLHHGISLFIVRRYPERIG
jgi:hypothetical protein